MRRLILAAVLMMSVVTVSLAAEPEVRDDRLQLTLVASEPEIVTPVGATFDSKSRLLVVEVHTHFPPDNYAGPKHDRIRFIEDTDGDGKADRFRTFYEGSRKTMSLAAGPDDWIYVATRMRVFRIRDSNGDDKADQEEEIVRLETKGDYPHNGLGGLAFDGYGGLLFGLGENLGEPYRLIGSDGTTLSGGGEGGNIYLCKVDGANLEKLATGFWNPFGICADPHGRIFCVGNDPDSMPPCRLLHVVPGGDYGYQFRYGRSGKHPLQAWDGELPGTLPMLAGTGEAPCAVLPYHGQLWVTSWGDYRIERYTLEPRGASFGAKFDVVVQGDENFRPVDFAVAPDGSLYFTDWVDRSYPVHGKGRIWRLSWKSKPDAADFPAVTDGEHRAIGATTSEFESRDPFLYHAAVTSLIGSDESEVQRSDFVSFGPPRYRLGLLQAVRRASEGPSDVISAKRRDHVLVAALRDTDAEVRLYALRWIADEKLTEFRSTVQKVAKSKNTTPALFQAAVATLEWLDTGKVANLKRSHRGHYFAGVLTQDGYPDSIRAMALRSLPPDHDTLTPARLAELSQSSNETVRRASVRTLALGTGTKGLELLADIAADESRGEQLRADAVFGLRTSPDHKEQLKGYAKSGPGAVRLAAINALQSAVGAPELSRPSPRDTDTWVKLVDAAGAEPDVNAGWRIFFGYGKCSTCHALQGRGGTFGPDLTSIAKRMPRRRLIQSILEPSREIAPRYVPWIIESTSGKTFTGIALNRPGGKREIFVSTDGKENQILTADIEARHPSRMSIMPAGFEKTLGPAELRSLIGLLEASAGTGVPR